MRDHREKKDPVSQQEPPGTQQESIGIYFLDVF
jgi:hypothetical protein